MKSIKMKESSHIIYQAKFTAGGLLLKENDNAIPFLLENGVEKAQLLRDNPEYLGTNSLSSRVRMVREILYRFNTLDKKIWKAYIQMARKDKCLLLYLSCLLAYPIIRDFHFKVIMTKWKELSYQLSSNDFQKFLYNSAEQHPEIEDWAESTSVKLGTVTMRMLNEAGFLENGHVISPNPDNTLLNLMVESGNSWFLEALLIPKHRRDELIK